MTAPVVAAKSLRGDFGSRAAEPCSAHLRTYGNSFSSFVVPVAEVPAVKVSAPQFMSSSAPPAVDAPAPIPDGPADPAAPPPPVEPPKQAVWPEWFTGVDNALLVMALLFAFLMASFAARNPDLFRHMAGGQRLLNGTYSLGSDPFSYTGADRPWVNQSWLFDLTVYAVYSADPTGAVAVVLKAVVFAAAFGVLLWFRRPGQAGWPWAVCIVAGALAASGTAQLRPIVFGMLFCSLLLLLLFRGDWTERRGRTLALVGGLCWLWGGFDSFALLGPLLLLVAAIAGAVQSAFDSPFLTEDGQPAAPPVAHSLFDSPPAHKTLFLAAAVGVFGVLLNPTFVIGVTKSPVAAVAQLIPYELAFGTAETMADDPQFRLANLSLFSSEYRQDERLGYNAGSVGLALLVLLGAGGLAVGIGRPPSLQLAFWVVVLLLCFTNVRFVPLFALVAVPLVSGLLNALSGRFPLGTTADKQTQGLLTASRAGRLVTVPLVLVLVAVTVPGWLQPQGFDPALARRLEWRIAADAALVRGAEQLQRWRAAGDLPAAARGLHSHPEFGDYAAWFAPAESVFVNTRYRFHAAELDDLVQFRASVVFGRRLRAADAPPPKPAAPVADKYGVAYVVLGQPNTATDLLAVDAAITGLSPEKNDLTALWHLDGRTAVVGRANSAASLALRDKLSMNPVRQAFGPQQNGLPDGPVLAPPPPDAGGWLAEFVDRPPQPAPFLDDAVAYLQLSEWTSQQEEMRTLRDRAAWVSAATGGWPLAGTAAPVPNRMELSFAELALPLLACRASRQALHESPDDPRGYFILALMYRNPRLPEVEPGDSARQRLTALARCAARRPAPDRCPAREVGSVVNTWLELFVEQVALGQLDLARGSAQKARETVTAVAATNPEAVPADLGRVVAFALSRLAPVYRQTTGQELPLGRDEFEFEGQAKKSGRNEPQSVAALLKKLDDAVTTVVSKANEQWDTQTRGAKPFPRAALARRFGLPGKAIDGIKPTLGLSAADAGAPSKADMALALVDLELEVGRLEEAAADLAELEAQSANLPTHLKDRLAALKGVKLRRQGNFREAIAVLDEFHGSTKMPRLTADQKLLSSLLPAEFAGFAGAAVGPLTGLLPEFRPPPNARQEALPALLAEFERDHADKHPLIAGHKARLTLLADAQHFYQRGVLALYDGDVATARVSFEEVFHPQGVPLDQVVALTQAFVARVGQRVDVRQYMPAFELVPVYAGLIDRHKAAPPAGGPK